VRIYLFLALTVVPLIELAILFRIAEATSWSTTLALVILTGALGAFLARREGLKTVRRIQSDLDQGVLPTEGVVEGALILAAGLMLVTPGVTTDLVGFLLLVPALRARIARRLIDSFQRRVVIMGRDGVVHGEPFIDVDAVGHDVDAPPPASPRRIEIHRPTP